MRKSPRYHAQIAEIPSQAWLLILIGVAGGGWGVKDSIVQVRKQTSHLM